MDSSWYFLRYCSPHDNTQAFDPVMTNAWGPCDIYIGGVEHAVLHLLYARFFTMVLRDMGLLEFGEPIRTDAYDAVEADDPMLVFNVTDQVRETIQQTLFTLLRERQNVFR